MGIRYHACSFVEVGGGAGEQDIYISLVTPVCGLADTFVLPVEFVKYRYEAD